MMLSKVPGEGNAPAVPREPGEPDDSSEPGEDSGNDDLDLDLEEAGDGDRLKEGFTGQER